MTFSPYRQTCHCGNGVETHFRDPDSGERGACLAANCPCTRYVNEHEPKPSAAPATRPAHARWCQCPRCKAYDAAHDDAPVVREQRTTDPWIPGGVAWP